MTSYDTGIEPSELDDLLDDPNLARDFESLAAAGDKHADLLARLQSRAPRRKRRRRHPVLRRALIAATSFTLLLAAAAAGVAGFAYAKYNGQIRRVTALQTHDPHIRKAALQAHAENFLIIGSDTRQGEGRGYGNAVGARADTTILVHLGEGHKRATVISFPRDSWVQIPACKTAGGTVVAAHTEMFNSAFTIGGPACTVATVQELTGIAVTHYVEIDFSGFKKIVDALGKITMCSPVAVDDVKSHLHLHPGNNQLGGAQALAYVRARESIGDGSDLGRIKRQQKFLGAVLRKAMSGSLLRNPLDLNDFLDAVTKSITLDQDTTLSDLRRLGSSLSGLDPKKVAFYTAPIANRDYSPPGTDYTGKVLLDSVKGRALYDSVIDDTGKPAAGTATTAKTAKRPQPTQAPRPDGNAAKATCSL